MIRTSWFLREEGGHAPAPKKVTGRAECKGGSSRAKSLFLRRLLLERDDVLPRQLVRRPGVLQLLELVHLLEHLSLRHLVHELDRHLLVFESELDEHDPPARLQ